MTSTFAGWNLIVSFLRRIDHVRCAQVIAIPLSVSHERIEPSCRAARHFLVHADRQPRGRDTEHVLSLTAILVLL